MIDLGSFDGSVSDATGSGAFDSGNGGYGSDNGSASTGSTNAIGSGATVGAASIAAINAAMSQMQFTSADLANLGGFALTVAGALKGGASMLSVAVIATGVIIQDEANHGGISQAITDIAHDMSLGLGVAISANPSLAQFETETTINGVTVGIGDDGSLAIMTAGRLYGLPGPSGTLHALYGG